MNIAQDDDLGDSLDGISGKVNVYLCGASLIAPQVSPVISRILFYQFAASLGRVDCGPLRGQR